MISPEVTGVVGVGSLGSKVELQALYAGHTVLSSSRDYQDASRALNPYIRNTSVRRHAKRGVLIGQVTRQCGVIHLSARPNVAAQLPCLPQDSLLIFHSSTMTESVEAAAGFMSRKEVLGRIGIVHCLMNRDLTVEVATDFGDTESTMQAFLKLGLSPRKTTVTEHDLLMWETQGWAVQLSEERVRLEVLNKQGLLTPSTFRILEALRNNDLRWTDDTKRSIWENPNNPNRHRAPNFYVAGQE